jgi:hypothetical protein
VYDPGVVCSLDSGCDLGDDRRHFVPGEWSPGLGVPLEDFAICPLDGKKMETVVRLADFDGIDDVRVLYAGAVSGLADKAGNSRFILTQLFP